MRGWAAFADMRFADACAAWRQMADMRSLNAPYVLPRAACAALLAGDPASASAALERLVATGAHGRALETDRAAIHAGLAALDGRRAEAIAGYRTALTGWRDLGPPWDESVTALMFVTLIGADDPDAHAAGLAAQVILRRLGAVRVLAMLDPLLDTAADAAQVAAHADRA